MLHTEHDLEVSLHTIDNLLEAEYVANGESTIYRALTTAQECIIAELTQVRS